jgi:hypothetical protein
LPFSPSTTQPIMSDYVNPFTDITLASLQEEVDVEAIDWSAIREDLESGPWCNLFDWDASDQGAEAQPDDW